MHTHKSQKGGIMIVTLVFTLILFVIGGGMLSFVTLQIRYARIQEARATALHIAEAGVNYYRWHLAHDTSDYEDGNGPTSCDPCGPYVHDFEGLGEFELEITPPAVGSTVVKIKSSGSTYNLPNTKRHIVAQYGLPSLARFSFLANTSAWFGDDEVVNGPIHGNGGIRMDGTNNNILTSSQTTYACGSDHGCGSTEPECPATCTWSGFCQCPGVWGTGQDNQLWQFPQTSIDFNSITGDLNQIKADALSDGYCIGDGGSCNLGGNSNDGFHITFLNNGTFDLYNIDRLENRIWQLDDDWANWIRKAEEIRDEDFVGNYAMPNNGLIFVGEDTWIDGEVNGKVTVAVGKLPGNSNTYKNVYINDNINYVARDGTNALGIISQNNIWVPKYAQTDITIDAAMIAQNGRIARNLYSSYLIKNSIEVYGAIMTNKTWTWTWVNGSGDTVDGYDTTSSIYDPNLIFSPPPSFPTSGEYEFISWEEVHKDETF